MSNLLDNGLERLSDLLRVRSNTKTAFKLITSAIEEILDFVEEQKKGRAGSLREFSMFNPRSPTLTVLRWRALIRIKGRRIARKIQESTNQPE